MFVFLGLIIAYVLFFVGKSKKMVKDDHIRGAKLLTNNEFFKNLKKFDKSELSIKIDDKFVFPRELENRHRLILGSTGSGKSNYMNIDLDETFKRKKDENLKEKIICYDVKSEYVEKHFEEKRGDLIFYPFDKRSVTWSFFDEVYPYS